MRAEPRGYRAAKTSAITTPCAARTPILIPDDVPFTITPDESVLDPELEPEPESPPPPDPVPDPPEPPEPLDPPDPPGSSDPPPTPALLSTKGLLSELTVAWVKSTEKITVSSCSAILAFRSVVANELPDFHPPTHPTSVPERVIDPALHDWQLEHITLATIWPSAVTPLPSKRVSCAAVSLVSREGGVWRVPCRGDSVIFPDPSWYTMNRLEFAMVVPVPSDTQEYEVGAVMLK